eukprot:TRINITY_DN20183_c0_g1_i1.p5 TRINITY_DN20183_c0_g1~~TRINITY_DN20183_c0_g1_i1.p5  ORF type:complete len:210 (+),score=79.29 TRINITY_DN20183_c0_g1_i1:1201-1830(+)
MEAAAQLGLLRPGDEAGLLEWLVAAGRAHATQHAPFMRAAHAAAACSGLEDVATWMELDAALDELLQAAPTARRASIAQGSGLLRAGASITAGESGSAQLGKLRSSCAAGEAAGHAATAFGALAALLRIPPGAAADAFAYCALRDAASAAVRLGLVGPLRGALLLRQACEHTERAPPQPVAPGEAAGAAPVVDCAGSCHEMLDMRLFVS